VLCGNAADQFARNNLPSGGAAHSTSKNQPLGHGEVALVASCHHRSIAAGIRGPNVVSSAHFEEPLSHLKEVATASWHHRTIAIVVLGPDVVSGAHFEEPLGSGKVATAS